MKTIRILYPLFLLMLVVSPRALAVTAVNPSGVNVNASGVTTVFLTFQVFGYLPDSQKSLHRYTDDQVVPREGMQGVREADSARLTTEDD